MRIADADNFTAACEAERRRWYLDGVRRGVLLGATLAGLGALLFGGCQPAAAATQTTPEQRVALPDLHNSGVTSAEAAELEKIYREAAQELRRIVLKPQGLKASSRQFRLTRAAELAARVRRITDRLNIDATDWVGTYTALAAERGRTRANYQHAAMGLRSEDSLLAASTAVVDDRAVRILAQDAARDLFEATKSMRDVAERALRETAQVGVSEADINRILAGGVILGTPRETSRELRQLFERVAGPIVQVRTRSGGTMHFDADYYASMVARTKTREATVVARHQRLGELGIDLVRIVGRVSDNFCTAFLGQVFSLSGEHPRYPAYTELPGGGPPFHPNCSKSSAPYVEALATPAEARRAAPLPDARKLLGATTGDAQRRFKDLQLRSQIAGRYAAAARS